MDSLLITKAEFLALAAIISKRPIQDELLEIEDLPLTWKIQSIHPLTKLATLVAYIPKTQSNELYRISPDNSRTNDCDTLDRSQAPTLHRYDKRFQ